MPKGNWREFDDAPLSGQIDSLSVDEPKIEKKVRVQKTRSGKRGKTVTLISGLQLCSKDFRSLLKRLKTKAGTGGTLKGDLIELQGDQVRVAIELLTDEGFYPKQAGG